MSLIKQTGKHSEAVEPEPGWAKEYNDWLIATEAYLKHRKKTNVDTTITINIVGTQDYIYRLSRTEEELKTEKQQLEQKLASNSDFVRYNQIVKELEGR